MQKISSRIPQKTLFMVLLTLTVLLLVANIAKAQGLFIPNQQKGIIVTDNVVQLDSMTLEQKIAQMVVVIGAKVNIPMWKKMNVGGMHLGAHATEQEVRDKVDMGNEGMAIPLFITADLEGCVNPFIAFRDFKTAADAKTAGEAYDLGLEQGKYLQKLGFNFDFAPVVDLGDEIWGCRAFTGTAQEVSEKAEAYIAAMQSQKILTSAKHYPGKTLVGKDPHKFVGGAVIDKEDILPYEYLSTKGNVDTIMVSHLITTGEVDTKGIPSVVSKEVLDNIKKDFSGLIVSDEIHMLGLKKFYGSVDEMYVGVYKAGNDIVLNFDSDPNEVYRMITLVADAVRSGEIPKEQIDESVTKVLKLKGFSVE